MLGKLSCRRCGAEAEASTQDEADSLIDHALGQKIGRPCSGRQEDLVWEGASATVTTASSSTEIIEEDSPKKTKKKPKRAF